MKQKDKQKIKRRRFETAQIIIFLFIKISKTKRIIVI